MRIEWPGGAPFAFSAVDDTDWSTVAKVKPIYDLLAGLGFRTTKSVWIFDGRDNAGYQGQTCEDPDYLRWVLALQKAGFEISLHNAAPVTSPRSRTVQALQRFSDYFGADARIHCNHRQCEEGLYWGDARLTGARRATYNWLTGNRRRLRFRGHIEGDPLFWGDLCRERIRYVRNFVFAEIDTFKACPRMPYHDPARPFVNYWFASSDGGSLGRFLRTYSRRNIDRLARDGGASIAYVHFGSDFVRNGKPHPEFSRRMEYLASRGGWFAPASAILERLRGGREARECAIPAAALRGLEMSWLAGRVRDALGPRPHVP